MSLPETEIRYTIEEYLDYERQSEERHEYLDGQIYAMAGESGEHGDVCTNLVLSLGSQLKGTDCRVRSKDTKVLSGPIPRSRFSRKGMFSYPDIVVICGEPQYLDEHRDVVLNPKLIIEVLSPSTELFDRSQKFWRYRTHTETLTDYVVVSQRMPLIEHYHRQSSGEWVLSSVSDIEGSLPPPSIGCTLKLTDVYDRVSFPAEPEEAEEPKIKLAERPS